MNRRFLAVFNVNRFIPATQQTKAFKEEKIITGNFDPTKSSDRHFIEDSTPLNDPDNIIDAELVGLHGLND